MKPLLPMRFTLSCWLFAQCLLVPLTVRAQDGGSPDGGARDSGSLYDIPDASAGSGGADRDNPEGEDMAGQPGGACRSSSECATRFSCTLGTCRYSGIRDAERVGCLMGPEEMLAVLGVALLVARRGRA